MALSRAAKTFIAAFVLLALLGYLIVVDVGLFAGRIHRGVRVQDIALGGLTAEEAVAQLEVREELLDGEPVTLAAEGIECTIYPFEVDWRARPFDTTEAAMDVGRAGGPLAALRDRIRAWLNGVRVGWRTSTDFTRMQEVLDGCIEDFEDAGHTVARVKLRYKIRRALLAWPRRVFRVPVESG